LSILGGLWPSFPILLPGHPICFSHFCASVLRAWSNVYLQRGWARQRKGKLQNFLSVSSYDCGW